MKLSVPYVVSVESSGGRRCDMVFSKGNPEETASFYEKAKNKETGNPLYDSVKWRVDYSRIGGKS